MTGSAVRFDSLPDRADSLRLLSRISKEIPHLSPRTVDRQGALFGAGNLGRMAHEYFRRLGIPLAFVVDNNAAECRRNPFWTGLDVLAPDDVDLGRRKDALLAVCVVTVPYAELAADLRDKGWTDLVPFYDIAEAYRDRHPLSNGWFAPSFSRDDIENTARVLEGWADDLSRAHHLQFIAWRRLREEWSFAGAPVIPENRFFVPEVSTLLTERESFADIGAHTGVVILRFMEVVGGRFEKVWAVEPDPANLAELNLMCSTLPADVRDRVQIIPTAVGSKSGERGFFHGLGYASQFSELGRDSVSVQTIDALGLSPTFMKLHLEGAELDSLRGAVATIRRHRPIVVATSYHNQEGLWELPQWLMREFTDYRFHLRAHSWCGTGSVIYAIPTDRRRKGFLS